MKARLAGTASLMLVAIVALAAPVRAGTVTPVEDAPPIAPFSLRDAAGDTFDNARLAGRWSLVAIGFTNCPDVCPFTLSNLEAVYSRLSLLTTPERLPQVVFVGVDPDRDAAILGDYVTFFHPDFVGVTGERDQIDILVAGIDGFYELKPPDAHGNYTVDHTAFVALVDDRGRPRARLSLPMEPNAAATYVLNARRDASGGE